MAEPTLIVPVKQTGRAKQRLVLPSRPAHEQARVRANLALAMAADAMAAACGARGVGCVVVVTDDPHVTSIAHGLGVQVLADAGSLNASLEVAASCRRGAGAVVLPTDLVGVDAPLLATCLAAVGSLGDWFIADVAGTGTTLLGRGPRSDRRFGYGPHSAARHAARGYARVHPPPGQRALHRDVDVEVDLWDAARAATGPRVAEVLARYGIVPAQHTCWAGTANR